jgi:hypothetical protein
MLAELGRTGDIALRKGIDAAHQAVGVTALHLRRITGAVAEALGRVRRETRDLLWDYRDVAADLRGTADAGDQQPEHQIDRPVLRVVDSER